MYFTTREFNVQLKWIFSLANVQARASYDVKFI